MRRESANDCSLYFKPKGGDLIKILSSNVGMESARTYSEKRTDAYSESSWTVSGKKSSMSFSEMTLSLGEYQNKAGDTETKEKRTEETSDDPAAEIKKRYEELKSQMHSRLDDEQTMYIEMQAACIDYLLMIFLGIDTTKWQHVTDCSGKSPMSMLTGLRTMMSTSVIGGTYGEYHYHEESEETTFSTKGTALTADGRKLSFNLDVKMSRSFIEESAMEIDYGAAVYIDPLVIQLSGSPASVSNQTFMFDIDADGIEDKIAKLVSGTGFLALDRNDDGVINDGSELFGVKSGNGFEELAEYDSDGNGWIDENDEIFDRLRIWSKDPDGSDRLTTLKESDVGAIYLDSRKTDFAVKDMANNDKAQVRRTGIFLRESTGRAGTIQQFDMVKKAYA
ncbi:MAG: hypothetical protein IJ641_04195 [Lachnospiraceae bacterium]|nr:hypothetical protein [Lachnospiraceae bacterium]